MNKFHPNAKICSGGICIIALIFGNALCYFRDCGTEEDHAVIQTRLERLLFDSYLHLAIGSTAEFSLYLSVSRVNYFILP